LEQASIGTARAAVILADPRQGSLADASSALIAIAIEKQSPAVHTIMDLVDPQSRQHLVTSRVDELVSVREIAGKLLAQSCITPWVKNVYKHLLSSQPGTCQLALCDLPPSLHGQTYRVLALRAIERGASFTVCGFAHAPTAYVPQEGPVAEARARSFVLNPNAQQKDTVLKGGDRLIVIAAQPPELERYLLPESAAPASN
jgi:hypothetical protein